jgi:hypothetical protein
MAALPGFTAGFWQASNHHDVVCQDTVHLKTGVVTSGFYSKRHGGICASIICDMLQQKGVYKGKIASWPIFKVFKSIIKVFEAIIKVFETLLLAIAKIGKKKLILKNVVSINVYMIKKDTIENCLTDRSQRCFKDEGVVVGRDTCACFHIT